MRRPWTSPVETDQVVPDCKGWRWRSLLRLRLRLLMRLLRLLLLGRSAAVLHVVLVPMRVVWPELRSRVVLLLRSIVAGAPIARLLAVSRLLVIVAILIACVRRRRIRVPIVITARV